MPTDHPAPIPIRLDWYKAFQTWVDTVRRFNYLGNGEALANECLAQRDGFEEGWFAALAVETPRWIPVEERLPEEGDKVLIARMVHWEDIRVAFWERGHWFENFGDENHYWSGVTHWQPLPELPR